MASRTLTYGDAAQLNGAGTPTIKTYCEMENDGGGWNLVSARSPQITCSGPQNQTLCTRSMYPYAFEFDLCSESGFFYRLELLQAFKASHWIGSKP